MRAGQDAESSRSDHRERRGAATEKSPAGDDPDRVLVERVLREGTAGAFRPLYERYKDKVYNTAYRITGDAELAQDVTQDVFVQVYERLGQFRFRSRFSSWLYRVAANRATDEVRRRGRERWLLDFRFRSSQGEGPGGGTVTGAQERGSSPVESAVESAEEAEIVAQAVAALSVKLRTVVVLRYFEGLSYEEVAQVIGRSVGTVKSRLSRAHQRLSDRLRKLL